ncbi:MAG TPA: penicillin-binding protein [Saprospiraceae bacterium]|nr:penicillin-binding protein [Saprospiraceae bacterium]
MSKHKELLIRVYLTMFGFGMCALLLSFQAVKISVIDGERWRAKGDSLWLSYFPVAAERGDILARDGSLLATSVPSFEIRMDTRAEGLTEKAFRAGVDSLAYLLSKYTNTGQSTSQYKSYLLKARSQGNRYLLIHKNATYAQLDHFKTFPVFRLGRNKGGLIIEHEASRTRPYGMLAARTIGYVRDEIQPVGLEGQFDKDLKGEEGKRLMRRLVGGTWIPVDDLGEIEGKRGRDIRTTLDIEMQDIVQTALLDGVQSNNAQYGTAILMEVHTGKIVAIANAGHSEGFWQEDYNYAIGTATEPGSTMKLASVMAFFEDGLADLDTKVNLNKGYKRFYNRDLKDSEHHGIEESNLRQVFEISSNVGIATLTHELYGSDRMAEKFIARLKQFGLHQKTGIEVPGEGTPLIKEAYSKEQNWSGTTLPWMSIGYECQITPLQLLTFYNAVANDGRMMKPYLVEAITDEGHTVKSFRPQTIDSKIASHKTIAKARELLEGVAIRGTASKIPSPHVSFAGKTGTAVTNYYLNDGHKSYQSSFVGYFPAKDPVYSCIILINDPKGGRYYGSSVALPVFIDIAEQCIALDPVEHNPWPYEDSVYIQPIPHASGLYNDDADRLARKFKWSYRDIPDSEWVDMTGSEEEMFLGRTVEENILPDVRGMGVRDALYLLENAGLIVRVTGAGLVRSQSLLPGTRVSKGMQIELKLDT